VTSVARQKMHFKIYCGVFWAGLISQKGGVWIQINLLALRELWQTVSVCGRKKVKNPNECHGHPQSPWLFPMFLYAAIACVLDRCILRQLLIRRRQNYVVQLLTSCNYWVCEFV
jgi:hypothetical protein